MLTENELKQLMSDLESDRVERTESTRDTKKFGEAICAFANDFPAHDKPGYLLIGVDDKGQPTGLEATDDMLKNFGEFRTNGNIIPPPVLTVQKFSLLEGDIIVIEVFPSRNPPVRYNRRVCIRVGPRRADANAEEERRLTEKRSHYSRSFDVQPSYGSGIEDMSLEIFTLGYLPLAVSEEVMRENHRELKAQLGSLKFYDLKADCPTNAGIILFGKNPLFFQPGAYIQYLRFTGTDMSSEIAFQTKFSGDLVTQLRNLDNFLKVQVIKEKPVFESTLREKAAYNYPFKALRELLMNAVLHRDYESHAPVKFYEFPDRIEISNPGGLYGSANPENFPTMNDYRNPALAEALKTIGYVNKFNRGVLVAQAELDQNNNPSPKFDINERSYFSVTVYARQL